MKNVTLAMEEKLLEESREYAQRHHMTLNALIRSILQREVGAQARTHWVDNFLELARKAGGGFSWLEVGQGRAL